MRKISAVLSVLLCAVFLTACGILPAIFAEPTAHATAPQETVSVTAVATLPTAQTLPQTQPTESVPPTVEEASVHSPLYMAELPVEDVIGFFNEVCLNAEYVNSGDPSVVQKWTGPLIYQIHGEPTEEDLLTLENFAAQLNHIQGFPGMRQAKYPEEATLNIHFCSHQEFLDLMGSNFYGADGGVTFWYEQNEIYNAIIGIRTDLSQDVRNSVILEEIYNGLGPVQDTRLRSDSIIFSDYSTPQALTLVDWLILDLLYHPDMQCGMDRQQCEEVIRSLYY